MGGDAEFRHGCSFCGWATGSRSPVMLDPSCSHCGCALDAQVASEPAPVAPALPLPPAAIRALRGFALGAGALTLYAAAAIGFHAGGVAGAMVALGAGGLLALPFVPERAGRRR